MSFTVEKAERLLPNLEKLMRKAQKLSERIAWILEVHEPMLEISSSEGFHYFVTAEVGVNKEFHRLYFQFYKALEELQSLGVVVRDLEDGSVDFPFKLSNREAFLSWQLGEDKIRFYRDVEDEFEGRRPLINLDEFLKK